MSLKLNKHLLLVLAVLMMLLLIPTAFAADDADAVGINDQSTVDSVSTSYDLGNVSAVDDVKVSASDGSDVLEASTTIYVDANAADGGDGTTPETAFKNINSATLNAVSSNGEIIIKSGTYTVSGLSINKNVKFTADGDVNLTTSGNYLFTQGSSTYTITFEGIKFRDITNANSATVFYTTYYNNGWSSTQGTLNFNYCDFINNNGKCLIYSSNNVNIKGCNFIENIATGTSTSSMAGLIFNYYGGGITIDISYSNFINNDIKVSNNLIVGDDSNSHTTNFNYNFVGTNTKYTNSNVCNYGTINNGDYTIITAFADSSEITVGDSANLKVKFTDNNNNELSESMANLTVTLAPTLLNTDEITVTISDNVGTGVYSATQDGTESVDVKVNSNKVVDFTFEVEPVPVGTVFVDAGFDGVSDGTKASPYKTIGDAITNLGTNTTISVKAGNYELNDVALNTDVTIMGKGDVVITTTSKHLNIGNNKVNLTNLIFKDATSTSIVSTGDLNITNCVFKDNAGENVIKTTGALDMAYSAFIGNTVTDKIVSAASGDVSNNFWGSNADPGLTDVSYTNWAVLNLVMDSEIYAGGEYAVNAKLTDNSGADLADSVAGFNVTFSKTNDDATLTPLTATVSDNVASATYVPSATGVDTIAVSIGSLQVDSKQITILEDDTSKIYVDSSRGVDESGRGSKAKPYKTIGYAISNNNGLSEIAINDGVYEFATSCNIAKSIKLVATGDNAIIKGTGSTCIFTPSYNYNIEFVGLTFTQSGATGYAFFDSTSSGSGSLKIINCTFTNTTTSGYGAIRAYQKTDIIGCTFTNITCTGSSNSAGYKGFIVLYGGSSNAPSHTMNYNIFVDVTYSSSLMVETYYYSSNTYSKANINYNYWGSNDGLASTKYSSTGVTCDNYLILETSVVTPPVFVNLPIELTAEFKASDDSAIEPNLVNKHITFASSYGSTSPTVTSISDNKITVTYTAASEGNENLVANIEGVELAKWTFNAVEIPAGTVLVDGVNGHDDASATGSAQKPYKSISYALDHLGASDNAVMVLAGEYTLSDYNAIAKDVTITGVGNVVINSTGTNHLNVGAYAVTLNNLVFKGATGSSIISQGALNIINSVFMNNGGDYVISTAGSVDISYTIFAGNNVNSISAASGTVENNFWGSNSLPALTGVTAPTNYVVLDMSIPSISAADTLPAETDHAVIVTFNSTDGTTLSELTESMHDFDVTLSTTLGEVTQSVVISDNVGEGNYISNVEGAAEVSLPIASKTISFTVVEREAGRIYVDEVKGDDSYDELENKNKAFKTLNAAIVANNNAGGGYEIIVNEGNYDLTGLDYGGFVITADVNITGRGNVVIDAQNRYFMSGSSSTSKPNVVLNNLTIINQGAQYNFQNANDLTIINCTVANGTGTQLTSSINGNIKIINSSFVNLTYSSSTFIYKSGSIDILNSVFVDVTRSSGTYTLIGGTVGDINGNFWGSNEKPTFVVSDSSKITSWIAAIPSFEVTSISAGQTPTLTVKFMSTTDGENFAELDGEVYLPKATLGLTSELENTFTPGEVTLENNVGTVTYTATNDGNEVINLTAGDNVIYSLEQYIKEANDPTVIYVDEVNGNNDWEGSSDNPVQDISTALGKVTDTRKTIAVLEGSYTISGTINNDVTIRWAKQDVQITATDLVIAADVTFDHLVLTSGNTITVNSGKKLTVVNTTFINNAGVISSAGEVEIKESKFINNTAGGNDAIIASTGVVNIKYSEFIANGNGQLVSGASGDVNDNYWGSNDKPNIATAIEPTSWVALVVELEGKDKGINASEVQKISFDFKNTTDGDTFTDLDVVMPALTVDITKVIGSIDSSEITLEDNTASITYTATTPGDETLTLSTDGVEFATYEFTVGTSVAGKIFVDKSYTGGSSDGSRLKPYIDIATAISGAQSGSEIVIFEGTYTHDNYYSASKNLIFTGVGEVILTRTAGSSAYPCIFYFDGYTYTFNNIIFANVSVSDSNVGSIFHNPASSSNYAPTININNCTFANNTGGKGVIYSYTYGQINIVGSKFINNTGSEDLIYFYGNNYASLNIAYSAFIDNEYTTKLIYSRENWNNVNLNNNFWGSNDKPTDSEIVSKFIPTTWIVVEAEINEENIETYKNYEVTLTFKSTSDGVTNTSLGDNVMPDVTVNFEAKNNPITSEATLSNNVATVAFNPTVAGYEDILINGNTVLTVFIEEGNDPNVIFVNQTAPDGGTGGKDDPFNKLQDALAAITDTRNRISLTEGSYEITGTLDKDVSIYALKTATVKATDLVINAKVNITNIIFDCGNKITVNAGETLNITDSVFSNNDGAIQSSGNLIIDHTKFLSNKAIDAKGVINVLAGTVSIAYSEFVNCSEGSVIVYSDVAGTVNNNYWGSNDGPSASSTLTADVWIKLDKEIPYATQGSVYDLTIKFVDNNGNDLIDVVMPDLDITLTPEFGEVKPTSAVISNNETTVTYNATTMETEKVSVLSEGVEIYNAEFVVDENPTGKVYVGEGGVDAAGYGSKLTPYATIKYALDNLGSNTEIVVLEGTYAYTGVISINKDVIISGRGAKLTRTGTGPLFNIYVYSGSYHYTLTLKDLIIENATASSSNSGVIYGYGPSSNYASTINIVNCTFNNNTGYSVVYGSQFINFNVTGSEFVNNIATYAIYASNYNYVDVEQTVFYNNTLSSNVIDLTYSWNSAGNGDLEFKAYNNIFIANGNSQVIYATSSGTNDINYNYYGNNNISAVKPANVNINGYAILKTTMSLDDLAVGDSAIVTLKFADKDGNDLDSMPAVTLNLDKVLGDIDSPVFLDGNGATATYTTVSQGDETITVKYGETAVETLKFYVDESPEGKIYVDEQSQAQTPTGSRDAPFKTIADAIAKNTALGGNQTIVIRKGTYELTNAEILDNITIKAHDDVVINGNGANVLTIKGNANVTLINVNIVGAKDAIKTEVNTKLDIVNSTFTDNDGVLLSNGETTVYRTVFAENAGTVIKAEAGSTDISYSVFTKNTGSLIESTITTTANNNFWGTSEQTTIENVTIAKWVKVTATLNEAPNIFTDNSYDVDVKFVSSDSGVLDMLPDVEVQLTSQFGSESDLIISGNEATGQFITYQEGSDRIDVTLNDIVLASIDVTVSEDESFRIYVNKTGDDDTGVGSRANPYQSITRALQDVSGSKYEIVVNEGVYEIDDKYSITKDVSIIGRGTVVLTRTGSGVLFDAEAYSVASVANLKLANLIIENVTTTYNGVISYAGYYSSFDGTKYSNLTIINCTFNNNKGQYGVIYTSMYSNLNVTESTFFNNTEAYTYSGGLITFGPTGSSGSVYVNKISINYNNFINNTANNIIFSRVSGDIDYNFWGSNEKPISNTDYSSYLTLNNWVVVTPSTTADEIYEGSDYEITAVFNYTADGTTLLALGKAMPDLTINLVSNFDEYDPNTITISNNVGNTTYKASASGDELINFTVADTKVCELAFTVLAKSTPVVTIDVGEAILFNDVEANVTVKFGDENGTGSVKLVVNGEVVDTVVLEDGVAKFTIPKALIKAGENEIVSLFTSDNVKYADNTTSQTFDVDLLTPTITVTLTDDVNITKDAELTITVEGTGGIVPTGNVTVKLGDIEYPAVVLTNGEATVIVPKENLTEVKEYTVNVTYNPNGDKNYTSNSTLFSFNVTYWNMAIAFGNIESVNVGHNITFDISAVGEQSFAENFTVVIKNATGATVATISTALVNDGTLKEVEFELPIGAYTAEISYPGDGNYSANSTVSGQFAVMGVIEKLTIEIAEVTYPERAVAVVNASVDGEFNITVEGKDYTVTVSQGTGNVTLDLLAAKDNYAASVRNIMPQYNDKDNDTTFNVKLGTIIAEFTIENVAYPANATAYITANKDGDYVIKQGTTEIATVTVENGQGNITFDILPVAEYTYELIAPVDVNYTNSGASVNSTKFNVTNGTIEINLTVEDVYYNNTASVFINASVGGTYAIKVLNETGSVVNSTDVTLVSGVAQILPVKLLTPGKYTVNVTTVVVNYNPVDLNRTFEVKKGIVFYNVTVENYIYNSTRKATITLETNIVGTAGKGYTIFIDDVVLANLTGAADNKTVQTGVLAAGNYTIKVVPISADEAFTYYEFGSASNSTNLTVSPAKAVFTVEVPSSVDYPNNVTLTIVTDTPGTYIVALIDAEGKVVKTEPVIDVLKDTPKYVNITGLDAGNYTANVTSVSSQNYTAVTNTSDVFVVAKAANTFEASVSNVVYPDVAKVVITSGREGNYNITVTKGNATVFTTNGTVVAGKTSVNITLLDAGEYNFTVTYENENYTANPVNGTFTVIKGVPVITINATGATYPQTALVNITSSIAGDYTLTIGTFTTNGTFTAGEVKSINVDVLAANTYDVVVDYAENTNYNATRVTGSLTIEKAVPVIYLEVDTTEILENATLTVTIPYATGTVKVNGRDVELNDSVAKYNIGILKAQTYELTIIYGGNDNLTHGDNFTSFTVDKLPSNLVVSVENTTYGVDPVMVITLDNKESVIVTSVLDDTEDSFTITNGTISKTLTGLDAGRHNVTITYLGSDVYQNETATAYFTIGQSDINVDVSSSDVTYPDSVTVTVTADASGIYNLTVGNKTQEITLVADTAQNFTYTLAAGTYNITLSRAESEEYYSVSKTINVTVAKGSVNITVVSADVVYPGVVVATVTSDVSGKYTVSLANATKEVTLEAGIAQDVTFDKVNAGNYTITASYAESENYTATSQTKDVKVSKGDIVLTINAGDVTYPDNVTVTVTADVAGEYSLKIGNDTKAITLEAGVAQNFTYALAAGTYTFTVSCPESDNYNAASASDNATVAKASITLTVGASNVTYPEKVTVTVTADVAGEYSLTVGNDTKAITLEAGASKDFTYSLGAGTYAITVSRAESENYTEVTKTASVNVAKVENTTVTVEANTPVAGENLTVSVTLPADATGKVSVKLGNDTYTADVVNGTATLSIPTDAAGNYTATVSYSGDDNYDFASSEVSVTVKVQGVIIAENIKRGVNSPYDYLATLVDADGKPISGVELTFNIAGETYTATTNASGIATVSAGLGLVDGNATVYDVTVTNPYTLENTTATTTIVPRLIVVSGDLTADYLENPPYVVQAIGDDGNPVGEGEVVQVIFAGFGYNLTTNASGHVVRTIGLAPGMYAVKACYEGYNTTATVFIVKQVLKVTSGTLKKTAKSYTLKATLKSSNGKALAGKQVKLTFYGKTYTVKTNSKGVASYTIKTGVIKKLKAGKTYVIKARYVNDIVKGKIKVVKK